MANVLADDPRVDLVDQLIVSFGPGAQICPEVAHPLLALQWELGERFALQRRLDRRHV